MKIKRRKLPLWRWDPFLLAVVLIVSLLGTIFERLNLPVISGLMLTVLLSIGSIAAILLVLPLFVRSMRRDGEGTFELGSDVTLLPAETDDVLPVVDGKRHQGSIEAAIAHGESPFTAVLVPGATAWLGRDYRVAVDLLIGKRVYRAGYLPREIDQRVDAVLAPLAETKCYVTVPASILNQKRPYGVRVAVGPSVIGSSEHRGAAQ